MKGVNIFIEIWTAQAFSLRTDVVVKQIMHGLIEEIKLTPVGKPVVMQLEEPHSATPGGITFIQPCLESHVAFHSWPEDGYCNITISSCKNVNQITVLRYLNDTLICRLRLRTTPWTASEKHLTQYR